MKRSLARLRVGLAVTGLATAMTLGLSVNPQVASAANAAGPASIVSRLTGPFAQNDTIGRYNIFGTDLGIMWDNGHGEILTAFGDTQSINGWSWLYGQMFYWRSNVLLRSNDRYLADGMTFTGHSGPPGHAKRLLKPNVRKEITIIPTAGIAANGAQYMTVMSVKNWGSPGNWLTNWSALVKSTDNGRNWKPVNAFRPNGGGNKKFQMGAFLKVGKTLYYYGTPDGRWGSVYLARVEESDIEKLGRWEYLSYGKWLRNNPDAATPIMARPNGELSVAWNDYLGKYISLAQGDLGVKLRTADRPEGPWSSGELVIPSADPYTGYAPYIHPWSKGSTLYFTYSISLGYQVYLMRLPLKK
ncbi:MULTISPECIES: DUF4185 domain-containing protein [unclassified Gordonia (in: high G+C Gram-positive bacteria)]|uniref:DUF4185 domain-containing protein n=1 Tax=unclassified Gordonia (in: high G+C Gram-positive bacteria) TaxID=2657482 RepID=UPI001F115959|nr:DUF4185 domain-containing protein [Gordonia sp. ABSL49_1]MCH5644542.1 DUF4185 domain-containing protein [Gordonia sp. ABSL49_1]